MDEVNFYFCLDLVFYNHNHLCPIIIKVLLLIVLLQNYKVIIVVIAVDKHQRNCCQTFSYLKIV